MPQHIRRALQLTAICAMPWLQIKWGSGKSCNAAVAPVEVIVASPPPAGVGEGGSSYNGGQATLMDDQGKAAQLAEEQKRRKVTILAAVIPVVVVVVAIIVLLAVFWITKKNTHHPVLVKSATVSQHASANFRDIRDMVSGKWLATSPSGKVGAASRKMSPDEMKSFKKQASRQASRKIKPDGTEGKSFKKVQSSRLKKATSSQDPKVKSSKSMEKDVPKDLPKEADSLGSMKDPKLLPPPSPASSRPSSPSPSTPGADFSKTLSSKVQSPASLPRPDSEVDAPMPVAVVHAPESATEKPRRIQSMAQRSSTDSNAPERTDSAGSSSSLPPKPRGIQSLLSRTREEKPSPAPAPAEVPSQKWPSIAPAEVSSQKWPSLAPEAAEPAPEPPSGEAGRGESGSGTPSRLAARTRQMPSARFAEPEAIEAPPCEPARAAVGDTPEGPRSRGRGDDEDEEDSGPIKVQPARAPMKSEPQISTSLSLRLSKLMNKTPEDDPADSNLADAVSGIFKSMESAKERSQSNMVSTVVPD